MDCDNGKEKNTAGNGPAYLLTVSPQRIGVYNGFLAGFIKCPGIPADSVIPINSAINLAAAPSPNLVEQEQVHYEWNYIYHGAAPLTESGTFNPRISQNKGTSFTASEPGEYDIYYNIYTPDNWNDPPVPSPMLHVTVGNKLEIINPPALASYYIDVTPAMPIVPFSAKLDGVPDADQADLKFLWTIKLFYGEYELTDTLIQNGLTIRNFDWRRSQNDEHFGGGCIKAEVKVIYKGKEYSVNNYSGPQPIPYAAVMGTNVGVDQPSRKTAVEGYIGTHPIYINSVVRSSAKSAACYETPGYNQFDSGGIPFWSGNGDGGVGIMQLTFSHYKNMTTLFNWKANVDSGLACCNERYAVSIRDFRSDDPNYVPLDIELIKQILAKYNSLLDYHYYIYYGDSLQFLRDTTYCEDCGSCPASNPKRNNEHYKDSNNNCNDANRCTNTARCYSDGAYNCSH